MFVTFINGVRVTQKKGQFAIGDVDKALIKFDSEFSLRKFLTI
jgi:hypothetical protein